MTDSNKNSNEQQQEIVPPSNEIVLRGQHLANQKEVMMRTLDIEEKNNEQIRQSHERQAVSNKKFIIYLSVIILIFIAVMTFGGYSSVLFPFLEDIMKYVFGAIGGSGLTIIYFYRGNKDNLKE